MTIEDMNKVIKRSGLKLTYRPVWEYESEVVSLSCRKTAHITEGLLVGTQAVCTPTGVQVWSPKKKLCKTIYEATKTQGTTIRLFDTEAEITIPYNLADTYLRKLGIKVKKQMSQATIKRLKAQFKKGGI